MKGWDLSCRDWQDRLVAGRTLVPDLPLWPDGDRAVAIYRKLRLADVPDTPTIAEANGEDDWFAPIVRAMFGSYDPATKRRMIREFFGLVPKKNSKTTYGALGLMLTALLMNERPRAPFGMAAPVKDIADLAFEAIVGAIELDPVLAKLFHVKHHTKTILHRNTKAYLEVMAFDPAAATGTRWAGFLLDETHEVSKQGKAAAAMRQVRGGMIQFPEAFLAQITTQSELPPSGIFLHDLERARLVRDGKKDFPVLPVLYEFPREMQVDREMPWKDSQFWPLVTPNLGKSVPLERLQEEFKEAEEKGPDELRAWASQHLNIEVGLALHANRWAGAEDWEAQATQLSLDDLLRRSEVVTIGIDGGGLDDMLGLAVLGRCERTKRWLLWNHVWVHPVALRRHKGEAEKWKDFEAEGSLTIVKRVGEDIEAVAALVKKVEESGLLDRVGVDPAGINAIVDAISEVLPWAGTPEAGKPHDRIIGIPQGWKLNGSVKTFERKVAGGDLFHGGTKMMNDQVGNARTKHAGNAILVTREESGAGKVDALLSSFNAGALMAMNPTPRKKAFQMFVY